jgi:hypothetical protein
MTVGMPGPNPEVLLLQTQLAELGYEPVGAGESVELGNYERVAGSYRGSEVQRIIWPYC